MPAARRTRSWTAAALAGVVVAGMALVGLPQATASPSSSSPAASGATTREDAKGYYDRREVSPTSRSELSTAAGRAAQAASLRAAIGSGAVVDIDTLTGTPANLMNLSGYLTGPSRASARQVALGYVRAHLAELGLRRADLSTLRLRQDYVDAEGTHHLSWTQSAKGVTVFGNGLKAHVSRDGRLVALQGSPVPGLLSLTAPESTEPRLSGASARSASARDVGATTVGNGDQAQLVWFVTRSGVRLGWSTYVQSGTGGYSHVVDAATGSVLYRRSTTQNDRGDAKVYDYYPGAAHGGKQRVVNVYDKGWLRRGTSWLAGTSVTAFADVNDDNKVGAKEKTPVPGTARAAQFTLRPFASNPWCSKRYVCSWSPSQRNSWRTNRNADVTNAFYLASNFHDYLFRPPFNFTPAAGNFSRAGGDPVRLNALDGANTANGLPDGAHIDNANMDTPPNGTSPTMQMYLFHFPGATNAQDPAVPSSSSLSADVLYHEYTHGLSNRLVVDAQGNSTLNSIQAGSMGEAWSDYYAMDYLVTKRLQPDTRRAGEVLVGKYLGHNQPYFRTEAIDCGRQSAVRLCTQLTGAKGGYTYGDFSSVVGIPEVHGSGEIWAQTLWSIRAALGHAVAGKLITRGMVLSPSDPTFLDERNAIIQADKLAFGGRHTATLWQVFANRGMGWYAGTIDGGDTLPAQDFHVRPPASGPKGTVSGTVTDGLSGDPLQGAVVRVTGHPGYTDVTDASGAYSIPTIATGTYQKVVISTPGYETVVRKVTVSGGTNTSDAAVRRDWASASGGGAVTSFNGPDYSPVCGPDFALDLSQGTGWGSTTGDDNGTPTSVMTPKRLVVKLPQAIDIGTGTGVNAAFQVDPTATCGDPGSASTGDFTIEVASAPGGPWTTVVSVSGEGNWLPRYQYSSLSASTAVANVQYVRLTLRSPQVPSFASNCPAGAYAGCQFTDFTELEVFGPLSP